jgi:hypothetical protein
MKAALSRACAAAANGIEASATAMTTEDLSIGRPPVQTPRLRPSHENIPTSERAQP